MRLLFFRSVYAALLGTFFSLVFFIHTARALDLSPARQTVVVDPGTSQVVTITVENPSLDPVRVTPEVSSFGLDPSGHPVFDVLDEAAIWVHEPKTSVTLFPYQKKQFAFDITVPQSAEPGEHFLALFVRTSPASGQIGMATRLGSLLFLHISGPVTEAVALSQFSPDQVWYVRTPMAVSIRLQNTGSIHVLPQGRVAVTTWRGQVIERQLVNQSLRKIFPRTFWDQTYIVGTHIPWYYIGPLTVQVNLSYGQTQQTITGTTSFWYVSPTLLLSVGFILVVLVGFIVRRWIKKDAAFV